MNSLNFCHIDLKCQFVPRGAIVKLIVKIIWQPTNDEQLANLMRSFLITSPTLYALPSLNVLIMQTPGLNELSVHSILFTWPIILPYSMWCDNDKCRLSIKLETHKGHSILHPHGRAMECHLWAYWRKIIIMKRQQYLAISSYLTAVSSPTMLMYAWSHSWEEGSVDMGIKLNNPTPIDKQKK